jgi:hypothetical protein
MMAMRLLVQAECVCDNAICKARTQMLPATVDPELMKRRFTALPAQNHQPSGSAQLLPCKPGIRCPHGEQALYWLCRTDGTTDYGITGAMLNSAVSDKIKSAEYASSSSQGSLNALLAAAQRAGDVPVVVHHQGVYIAMLDSD